MYEKAEFVFAERWLSSGNSHVLSSSLARKSVENVCVCVCVCGYEATLVSSETI